MTEKIHIKYDIKKANVASGSAMGYIVNHIGINKIADIDFSNIVLTIVNMTEKSNLNMLSAFVEDLICLEKEYGVTVVLTNENN